MQTGFPMESVFRHFTNSSNPHRTETVNGKKSITYPKVGFNTTDTVPQYFYNYPVFKNYSPSENGDFFNTVIPNIFGSATVNSMQETLNHTAKNASAISTFFAENTDFSNAFLATNLLSDNHVSSEFFQSTVQSTGGLQRNVISSYSSHKGEELRQAVKSTQSANSSSAYNGGTEIRVDMSGMHNTVNSRADMDELIDRLCSELSQTALSVAEGVQF